MQLSFYGCCLFLIRETDVRLKCNNAAMYHLYLNDSYTRFRLAIRFSTSLIDSPSLNCSLRTWSSTTLIDTIHRGESIEPALHRSCMLSFIPSCHSSSPSYTQSPPILPAPYLPDSRYPSLSPSLQLSRMLLFPCYSR